MPIPSVSSSGVFLTAQTDFTVNTGVTFAGTGDLLLVLEQNAYTGGVGLIAPKLDGVDMTQVGTTNVRMTKWVAMTTAGGHTLSTRCAASAYDAHLVSWRTWQDTATSGARYQNAQSHAGTDNNPRTSSLTCPPGGALDAGFFKLYNGAGALVIDSAGGSTSAGENWAGGSGSSWGGGYRTTDGPIVWVAGDGNQWSVTSMEILGDAPPALTGPNGSATGPTQATIGVTSDTAPTTTTISYQILPAATATPSAITITSTPDGTISTGSAGALTKDITGLTTNTAIKVHFAQGSSSNVVSTTSFTPNTLAISGTALSPQSGAVSTALVWTGATPNSLLTNAGNGSGTWSVTSGIGASGITGCNASTGVPIAASLGAAGSYTITLTYTDSSTVPSAQTITKTFGLTIYTPDATSPDISGSVTVSNLLATSYTLTWPAATDNVAVTGYEYSLNGGSTYTSVGNALTVSITGRTAGTTDQIRVRAYDGAGNRSSALAASVTLPSSVVKTPPLENTDGTLHLNANVNWSWYPGGRIGSFGAIVPQEGVGTTNAVDGTFTIGTLTPGTGVFITCVRAGSASMDSIHYHFITVT